MSRANPGYEIGRPTGVCAASGRTLEPGAQCMATLCSEQETAPETDQDGQQVPRRNRNSGMPGFQRLDFSLEAWDGGQRPKGLIGYWKMTVPSPDAPRLGFIDDQALLDLFNRLQEDENTDHIAFRFVVGLILVRKKLLKRVRQESIDGVQHWYLLERGAPAESEPMVMIDPGLADDDARQIADQLGQVLKSDL